MLVEVNTNELGRVRAAIEVHQPHHMLVELSINPVELDPGESMDLIARLTACAQDLARSAEGELALDQVIGFVKTIHEEARTLSTHVITTMRIEDRRAASAREAEVPPVGRLRVAAKSAGASRT